MEMSVTKQVTQFFRFMRLFRITFFSLLFVDRHRIRALVAWQDDCPAGIPNVDDTQEVAWDCNGELIDDALEVGEHALDTDLITSDRICIDLDEIQRQFGWSAERSQTALDVLLNIRATMIDDGKESDEFLLHK